MVSAIGPGAFLHLSHGDGANENDKKPPEKEHSKGIIINGKREDFELLVCDLRSWNLIRAKCRNCNRERTFSKQVAVQLFGSSMNLSDLERRMKCTGCNEMKVELSVGNIRRS